MDDFEVLLQESLQRVEAPEGFERRVMAAVNRKKFSWRPLMAMAAMLALVVGAAWNIEESRREREQGEAAKAKLAQALRITSTKLQKIQQSIDAVGEGY